MDHVSLVTKAYKRYKVFWINLARTSLLSQEDGEDIVHAIVGSLLGRNGLEFESLIHVRNYVARAVLNRAIQIRQRGLRACEFDDEVSQEEAPFEQEAILERQEERSALRVAIAGLTRQDFEIIKLRFYSGLTFAQISSMLDVPVSTLKSREDAAIRRIRKSMQRQYGK
ncbi:MAG: sigma-70 family RNA polymerase sigma factor [Bacteroidetes bacterium]|nr:sigma-70 family RNA polymerase sigma factor [Bacteroidota bacterium]